MEWFSSTFPWNGSFPGFVNQCLEELRDEWGDKSPARVVPKIVKRVVAKGAF